MSYDATNWAIKQRGIKPASKIVLWHLCDRYHPDHGCFPSQATLAHDCEMSRASINRCIDELEASGLVKRHPRIDPKTKKRTSTSYTFSFQKTVSQNETRDGIAMSQIGEKPCLKNDDSRVSNCDTNVVREPIREQVNARDRADDLFSAGNERDQQQQTPEPADQFEEIWDAFPKKPNMPGKELCRKEYLKVLKKVSHGDLLRAVQAYAKMREGEDPKYTSRLSKWLRDGNYEGFLNTPQEFNVRDLSETQHNWLAEGRVPPSMLEDGRPNAAARYFLKHFGFEVPA